jgi:acyl carrier protein
MMPRKELLLSFDDVLQLPSGTLKGEEKLENLENWDSMAIITLMALGQECGVRLSDEQLISSRTISDVLELFGIRD